MSLTAVLCANICSNFLPLGKKLGMKLGSQDHRAVIMHLSRLNQGTDFHKIWSGQYAIRGHLNHILFNIITLDNKIANVP
jgi:hypothetical protein